MICAHCDQPTHIGTTHPCCERWAALTPGEPCPACTASRNAPKPRTQPEPYTGPDPNDRARTLRIINALEAETVEAMRARYHGYGINLEQSYLIAAPGVPAGNRPTTHGAEQQVAASCSPTDAATNTAHP